MKKLHSIFLEPTRTNGIQSLVNLPIAALTDDGILKTNLLFSSTYLSYIYIYIYMEDSSQFLSL